MSIEPPVAIPDRFSAAGDDELPERWWAAFDDPALDRLIDRALRDNLDILAAWDRLAQAAASARAAGAPLWPHLDAEAGASYGVSNQDSGSFTVGLGLTAQYELDLWGRIRSTRDAANADLLATEENLRATAISLSATIASTWYSLVERREQLALLEQQDGVNQRVLELVNLQFKLGRANAADLLQQRQLVESNRGDQARVRAQIAVLEHQLAVLVGAPPLESVAEPNTTLVALPPLPRPGLPAELVSRRPDVRAAWLTVEAANYRLATAIAERFPRLSLTASISTSAPDVRDLFDNWLINLAANLLGPLFRGGQLAAESDRARAAAAEALHYYGSVVLDAFREVEDALTQEQRQRELLASLDAQVALSAQVIDRARDNYTKGAESFLRVLDAMLKHQTLQRNQKSAQLALIQNRIALCKAIAGGWSLERTEQAKGDRDPEDNP